jgi:hypothetical protein
MGHEERGTQPMERLLDTRMAHAMGLVEYGCARHRRIWQEDAPFVQDDVVNDRPVWPSVPAVICAHLSTPGVDDHTA